MCARIHAGSRSRVFVFLFCLFGHKIESIASRYPIEFGADTLRRFRWRACVRACVFSSRKAPAPLYVKCSRAGRARPGQLLCATAKESVSFGMRNGARERTHTHTHKDTRATCATMFGERSRFGGPAGPCSLCACFSFLFMSCVCVCVCLSVCSCDSALQKSATLRTPCSRIVSLVCFRFRCRVGVRVFGGCTFIINAFIYLYDPRSMRTAAGTGTTYIRRRNFQFHFR